MANEAPAARGQLVTRDGMATILGVARTTLDDWVRRGCPVHRPSPRKGVPAQFDTAAVLEWRQTDVAAPDDKDSAKADREKGRLYRAQANRAERADLKEAGQILWAHEVLAAREAENVAIRDRIRAVPSTVADRIVDAVAKGGRAPQVAAIILAELDEALEEIADAEAVPADADHDGRLGGDDLDLPGGEAGP